MFNKLFPTYVMDFLKESESDLTCIFLGPAEEGCLDPSNLKSKCIQWILQKSNILILKCFNPIFVVISVSIATESNRFKLNESKIPKCQIESNPRQFSQKKNLILNPGYL